MPADYDDLDERPDTLHRTLQEEVREARERYKNRKPIMDPSTRTFFVAGVKFRQDWRKIHKHLLGTDFPTARESLEVKLIGEPSNAFDKYAVKVLMNNEHVGYIPKPINIDIWALRDAGLKPVAKLVEFNPDAETYGMFKVEVSFERQKKKCPNCENGRITLPSTDFEENTIPCVRCSGTGIIQ